MVATVEVRVQYNCNGAVVDFVFDIVFFDTSDLIVNHLTAAGVESTLTEGTDYDVAGDEVNGRYPDGGTITTVATYPTGDTITIIREIPLTQLVNYSVHRSLPQEIQETVVDQLTCMIQQFQDYLDRSLYFPTVDPTTLSGELPRQDARLGLFLRFHQTTGEPEAVALATDIVGITAFMLTLIDDVDAATARKTLTSIKVVADADYTMLDDDGYTDFLFALVTTERAFTLPTAAENTGREVYVKIISNTSGKLWIDGEGAERINGILGGWQLRGTGDWMHLICDGSDWHVKGHHETELIYWKEADWQQTSAAQNTWYAITDFDLSLPTGGEYEIEFSVRPTSVDINITLEVTVADGSAEEDDDKYTINMIVTASQLPQTITKAFRRTFGAGVTLHVNMRTINGTTPTIRLLSSVAYNYLRARRIA